MSSAVQSGSKGPEPTKAITQLELEQPLPPGWARIASKKRAGKFYYFNASTNTSLWEHPARSLTQEAKIVANVACSAAKKTGKGKAAEKVVQLQNDTQFKKKNLAKQRMESIRTQLEVERKDEEEKKVARKTASPKRKPEVKAVPSPKKADVAVKKPEAKPVVPAKKPEAKPVESKWKPEVKKASPKQPDPKKLEVVKTSSPRQKRKLPVDSPKSVNKKPMESTKTSAKSHAIAKKASPVKPKSKTVQQTIKKELESLKQFKIPKKPPEDVSPVSSPVLVDIRKLEEVKPKVPVQTPKSIPDAVVSPKPSSEPPPRCQSTPKVAAAAALPQETFTKSPANDRLAQLRNQIAQNVDFDEDAEMTDLSVDTSTTVVKVEEMEWEDIPEEVALQEVVTIRRSLGLKLASADSGLNSSIPEHQFDQVASSFQRFFFVVVDTNIFLSHLKALEQLLSTGIPTVGQPILIIPYIVLQELDRIKHREAGRPLSQAACRSIRFLNDLLKRRDPRVRGQSTIEAAAPIIPIENPDDHIVNCCCQQMGQLGQQGPELFLLSNDVNLRNKALVSGLTAVSFGELMAEADRLRKVAATCA